jgi:hypothetical protein
MTRDLESYSFGGGPVAAAVRDKHPMKDETCEMLISVLSPR